MDKSYGDHVAVSVEGLVAVVTLNRPPHNFVSVEFMRDLADAMQAADGDAGVRAILLRAEGKSFCAGADFAAPNRAPPGAAPGAPGASALYEQAVRLYAVKTPIVAAVQGAAIGAGLGLALVADFRVASPEARFAANFVKLGFHPGFGITHALPRLIGKQKASLMMLTGRRIRGEEAMAWGLVDELAADADLLTAAKRLADEIAENAPLAVVATRATVRAALTDEIQWASVRENVEQMRLLTTEDFREGVRAVAERRAGNFVGR